MANTENTITFSISTTDPKVLKALDKLMLEGGLSNRSLLLCKMILFYTPRMLSNPKEFGEVVTQSIK